MSLKVDQALISSFINAGFGLPIAHENIEYTPTPGTAFVRITVFDAGSEARTVKGYDEQVGIFQAVLHYPVDSGAAAAKTTAEQIMSHFYLYSRHTYDGQAVDITSHERGPGAPEEGWYKIRLRMNYRAFTERQ